MRKMNNNGFALMEVLVLIMIILIFLTSLFGMTRFRNQVVLAQVQKKEAAYAAEAAVELMAKEILHGESGFAEESMDKTETVLSFEPDDGSDMVRIPVTIWAERNGNKLVLYAEAEVGEKKETAHLSFVYQSELSVMTPSSAERAIVEHEEIATPSSADASIEGFMESAAALSAQEGRWIIVPEEES